MRKIADAGCADAERRGITTGAKRFTFASQQNGADRGSVLRSGDRFAKGGAHRIVHCIMAIGTVERDQRYLLCDIDYYDVSNRTSFLNKSSRDVSNDRTAIASAPRLTLGTCS